MKTIRTIAKINTLVVFPIVLAYHESKRFRKMIRFIRTTKPSELIDYTEINAICATLTVVSKLPEQTAIVAIPVITFCADEVRRIENKYIFS